MDSSNLLSFTVGSSCGASNYQSSTKVPVGSSSSKPASTTFIIKGNPICITAYYTSTSQTTIKFCIQSGQCP